jgi:hypothetical protein
MKNMPEFALIIPPDPTLSLSKFAWDLPGSGSLNMML